MENRSSFSAIIVVVVVLLLLAFAGLAVVGGGMLLFRFNMMAAEQARRSELAAMMANEAAAEAQQALELANEAQRTQQLLSSPAEDDMTIDIAVDGSGGFTFENEPIKIDDLGSKLNQYSAETTGVITVSIEAAPETPFRVIVELLDLCQSMENIETVFQTGRHD